MFRSVAGRVADRSGAHLRRAFDMDHTTTEVARSFGLGVFVTMLPTFGVGFLLFFLLAALFDRLSRLALLASVAVFNPVVKWGVYALSFALGTLLLGPVEGVSTTEISLSAAPPVVTRLVLGNVVLAVVAAVPSYFLAYRIVDRYGDGEADVVETVGERLQFASAAARSGDDE